MTFDIELAHRSQISADHLADLENGGIEHAVSAPLIAVRVASDSDADALQTCPHRLSNEFHPLGRSR